MVIGSVLSHSKFLKIDAVLMVGKNEKLSSVGSCTTALIIGSLPCFCQSIPRVISVSLKALMPYPEVKLVACFVYCSFREAVPRQ
jgi:hypothetical protein